MCKNVFSYPDGTVFTGQEILDFINYHLTHNTSKTKIARYMCRKFSKIKSEMQYKFFAKWVCVYTNTLVNKPRLLRVDHTSPISVEHSRL